MASAARRRPEEVDPEEVLPHRARGDDALQLLAADPHHLHDLPRARRNDGTRDVVVVVVQVRVGRVVEFLQPHFGPSLECCEKVRRSPLRTTSLFRRRNKRRHQMTSKRKCRQKRNNLFSELPCAKMLFWII